MNVDTPLSSYETDIVLHWAQQRLEIADPDFVARCWVSPFDPSIKRVGSYDPSWRLAEFNGPPLLDTVFHEAMHFKQHERGDPQLDCRFKSFTEYWDDPAEVEARSVAVRLVREYLSDYCD